MNKKRKALLIGCGLLASLFVASSCTANFCSNKEKARLVYAFESGTSEFYLASDAEVANLHETEEVTADEVTTIYRKNTINVGGVDYIQYIEYNKTKNSFKTNSKINTVISSAASSGIYLPSIEYFERFDSDFFKTIVSSAESVDLSTSVKLNEYLTTNGYLKFYNVEKKTLWGNFNLEIEYLRENDQLGWEKCPSHDFVSLYKSTLESTISNYRACITTIEGDYGSYNGGIKIHMEKTTWGDAWDKGGHLIEGLIVYPVAWMLDSFANLFANKNPINYNSGIPQILSLLVVTVIVRLFIFLVTIKSTLSQQKMTALQPELAKIQQKYPNANTNQAQKQRLAEEQMRLYKKNKVNPLSSLLVLIVQFPVFIGVWGAMTGSAVLSTGTFLKLDLSASIWDCLKKLPSASNPGWWTALVLILLMSAGQFFSMKVPQWLQKARTKKVSRLAKNPAEQQQQKTANIVSYAMLVMIIFMGFTLPAAMGVYWFIGAIVSLAQSLIMNAVTNRKQSR